MMMMKNDNDMMIMMTGMIIITTTIIRIFHGCEVWIEKSVPRVIVWQHRAVLRGARLVDMYYCYEFTWSKDKQATQAGNNHSPESQYAFVCN